MEVNIKKPVNIKTISVQVKVTDRFNGDFLDVDGNKVFSVEQSYVPDFFPGIHGGDYLELDIDIKTGQIVNWEAPGEDDLQEFIDEYTES